MKRLVQTFACSLILVGSVAFADTYVTSAKSFVDALVDAAQTSKTSANNSKIAKEKVAKISAFIDYPSLAKRSLGKHWTKLKDSERQDFLKTLQELLEVVVYPEAGRITVKTDGMSFTPWKGQASQILTTAKIEQDKDGEVVEKSLEFALIFDAKSKKIVDSVIEGEMVSSNLKRQFDQALQKKTFADVLARMKKRVAESGQNAEKK